jgi:hypothetical protein
VTVHNAQGTQTLPLPEQTPGWEHFWIDELVTGRELSLDAAQALEITRLSLAARQAAENAQAINVNRERNPGTYTVNDTRVTRE